MKKNIKTTGMKRGSVVDVAAALSTPSDADAAAVTPQYHAVVGLDVGDRQSHYCVLDLHGGEVAEGAVKTTEASLRVLFDWSRGDVWAGLTLTRVMGLWSFARMSNVLDHEKQQQILGLGR